MQVQLVYLRIVNAFVGSLIQIAEDVTVIIDVEILSIHFSVVLRGWVRKFCHRCYNFVNRHDRLMYYTLIERTTFLLYNDAKRMHERNKYFEIDALKDTWGKTNGTFS